MKSSIWSKWDLDLHGPEDKLGHRFTGSDQNEIWENYISALASSGLEAIALTNHFCIEGLDRLLAAKKANKLPKIGVILANIKFRIAAENEGKKPIFVHVIFSDAIAPKKIREFLERLPLANTDDSGQELFCSLETLQSVGFDRAVVREKKLREHLDHFVKDDEYFVARASNALCSNDLEKWCSFLFGKKNSGVEPKAILSGSDAHILEQIGKKATWIESEPSTQGLRRALAEPKKRIFTGREKPKTIPRMEKKRSDLTTTLGGMIDRLTYWKIAAAIVFILVASAIGIWACEGAKSETIAVIDLPNALYFSIITFSSLGYGDFTPTGFGKVIASLEILGGLAMTAIFVGKIASERQSAMLKLIYTSEHQRRLVKFEKEIRSATKRIKASSIDHNHEKLRKVSKKTYRFIAALKNYLVFQANHGGLATFGNESALKKLYQSLSELQNGIFSAFRTYGVTDEAKTKLKQLIFGINGIASSMHEFHREDEKISALLKEIQRITDCFKAWKDSSGKGEPEYIFQNELTDHLLDRIFALLGPMPWPKDIHKTIAHTLSIQNSLAKKGITQLIKDKRIKEELIEEKSG